MVDGGRGEVGGGWQEVGEVRRGGWRMLDGGRGEAGGGW